MSEGEEYSAEELAAILALHKKWWFGERGGQRASLDGANLVRASLVRASLAGANLDGANLDGANLDGANLDGASLAGANLDGASLAGANLAGANLVRASLVRANLVRASLAGANLVRATLPNGVRWDVYLAELVPALLTAGGKALLTVANERVWACHSWDNCPMAEAFTVHSPEGVPPLYRWEARLFVQLFDAKLIPLCAIPGTAAYLELQQRRHARTWTTE